MLDVVRRRTSAVLGATLVAILSLSPAGTALAVLPPVIDTVAGDGTGGLRGDGGPALSASLSAPHATAFDPAGNMYVADTGNNVVRKVDTTGRITTFAGTGAAGSAGDGGPATRALIKWPHSVAADDSGNVYIADSPNHRVRRVGPDGVITTVAGTGRGGFSGDGGPASRAEIDNPKGIAVDRGGALYIADTGNNRVRRVDPSGVITTVAGNGQPGGAGDGGGATAAQVTHPRSVTLDGQGNLYISEDSEGEVGRIRKVAPGGTISRFAGTGVLGYSGDGGPATLARLNRPRAISADWAGNLFIADSENHRIRMVDLGGTITTVVGDGVSGSSGDGGPAGAARVSVARGVTASRSGAVYISDTDNNRVRRVTGLAVSWPAPATATAPAPLVSSTFGYWLLGADGRTYPFGAARLVAAATAAGPAGTVGAVDMAVTPSADGYWVLDGAGRVAPFGGAPHLGDAGPAGLPAGEQAVSLSPTPSGRGYWIFTARGRALPFGDAPSLGGMGAVPLNGPVLDSVATPTGRGYWMVASDGGVFSFGDARFAGAMAGTRLRSPVRSLVPDPDGAGYWLVAGDGGVFALDAPFRGSLGDVALNAPVVGMVSHGDGYLMVGADGGVFNFSDRPFLGSLGAAPPPVPIVAVAAL